MNSDDRWTVTAAFTGAFLCLLAISACTGQRSMTSTKASTRDVIGVMVVDGNSWTQSRHGATAMPENVWRELGSPAHFRVVDEAESGIGMTQMLDPQHQRRVDAQVVPGKLNVLIVWEGCHDLAEGFSADEAARRLREYYQRRKSAGFVVLTLTLLPCRQAEWPSDYDSRRDALNQMILATPREYADYVVDVSDLTDPDVFSPIDHVHLTDSGSVRVAKRVALALRPLLLKS